MNIILLANSIIVSYASSVGFCRAIAYANQHVFVIVQSNGIVFVWIYSILDNSLTSNQTFFNPSLSTNLNIQTATTFYTVSFAQSVYVYYLNNYSAVCNLTSLRQNIYDIKINDHWIYLSFSNVVEQYDIGSCMLFGNYSTNTYKLIQTHQAGSLSMFTRIFLLMPGQYSIDVLNVEDRYVCAGGCVSCINFYGLDGNAECYYTGIDNSTGSGNNMGLPTTPATTTSNTSTFNSTSTTNSTPPINTISPTNTSILTPSNSTNSTNLITPTNSTTIYIPTNSSTQNLTIPSNPFNQLICSYKCQACSSQPTNCTECSYKRTLIPNNTCLMSTSSSLIYTTMSLANIFRPSSSQFAYYIIDNLQLYQYHSKHYAGIISDVLVEINYVESMKWSVISVDNLLDWTRTSYFNSSLYNQYTNYRFFKGELKENQSLVS